jgi:glycosyltransferase involved in cell wall biosynthesis
VAVTANALSREPQLRILHTESSLNWGGQEKRICDEAHWLRGHGHECVIACPPHSQIFRHATELGLPVAAAPMRNSMDLRGMLALRAAIRQHRIQLINTHGSKDTWLVQPFRLRGLPVVRTRHITDAVRRSARHSLSYRKACDRVVASAACIKEALVRDNHVPAAHIEVIGEFVDLDYFHPLISENGFRARYGVPADSPLFIVVGMIRSEKGQTTFVDAALRMLKTHPQARFGMVGEGVDTREMEHKCVAKLRQAFGENADLTRSPVFMTGLLPDVRPAMAAADVIVVPSHAEAQSRVLPEAFAMGKCCLASRVGGIPEIVEHDRTGWLVPPRDNRALAEAMRLLADDPALRQRLASPVRAYAEQHFSIDVQMEKTLELYRRLLGSGRHSGFYRGEQHPPRALASTRD